MKRILGFAGSPRRRANSTIMLNEFMRGAKQNNAATEIIDTYKIDINFCQGCLVCNVKHKCIVETDQWQDLSRKILEADVLVFASPVYFHHVSASLKRIIDRFRSFVHIQMSRDGLIHTPYHRWEKDFVLLLSMGTVEDIDAQPIIDLFEFIVDILGEKNRLFVIKAKRVAIEKQLQRPLESLKILYEKLDLPQDIVEEDFSRNQEVLKQCYDLGVRLSAAI